MLTLAFTAHVPPAPGPGAPPAAVAEAAPPASPTVTAVPSAPAIRPLPPVLAPALPAIIGTAVRLLVVGYPLRLRAGRAPPPA